MRYAVVNRENRGLVDRVFFDVLDADTVITRSYVDVGEDDEENSVIIAHIRDTIIHDPDAILERVN